MKQKAAKEFLVGKYGSDPSAMGLAAAQAPFDQSGKKGHRNKIVLLVLARSTGGGFK